MDKKIRNKIIEILKEKCSSLFRYEIIKKVGEFPIEKINHIIDILADEGLIKITLSNINQLTGDSTDYIELTSKGYDYKKSLYRKVLNFISDDMTKIFSLVSLIISILIGLKQLGII